MCIMNKFKAIKGIVYKAMSEQDENARNAGLMEAVVQLHQLRDEYREDDERDCDGGQSMLGSAAKEIEKLQQKHGDVKVFNEVMWYIKAAAHNLEGIAV